MTDKIGRRLEIGILALVFGAGGGWAAFQLKLSVLSEKVERIDERVSAMYCAQVPLTIRAACK